MALKTNDGKLKGKTAMYSRVLEISRQAFYEYLENRDKPYKYEQLADKMKQIIAEDECNDTYGSRRIYEALKLSDTGDVHIPSERTVYRIMQHEGLVHRPKHKPNGITKADKEARKSDDLLKRDFSSNEPFKKCVTDITEIKAKDGKLYVSAVFDCFNSEALGLAMADNMRAELCVTTIRNAVMKFPELSGAIVHSDRGSQYTSAEYRAAVGKYNIVQSMNSAGGKCHDNARCESMWGRMKEELLYGRYKTENLTINELKTLIWRYFMSYWNNRRICSSIGGLPPAMKRKLYFKDLRTA